ncbi:protein-glutamate methylesterase/protein-glutamine glutaminase [Vibrio mediterranei]|uniref:protein-glutamate methylesterase/protein-glutamine glutaminase n=1 Tax=Vibrio mediterranei TaxID=689 RepID=UPI000D1805C2|nr:chemotaxis response regulator protein-glutamate methylesterase [Vibrio mediterranei]MCG9659004.1 chemotaxis response regulator protein-glutamate methylesterase [Vibrio mediterranei]PTC06596.1 chemotaxis response regulator protein-glutamate methylesterase [Vibrio mediterranei]
MPLKVLITDSCSETCQTLRHIINAQTSMTVVGIAHNVRQARALIKQLNPDVVTLAIELEGMNGLDFLNKIMTLRPMPVVVISKLLNRNSLLIQQALKLGAMACVAIPKTTNATGSNLDSFALDVIKNLKQAHLQYHKKSQLRSITLELEQQLTERKSRPNPNATRYLIAIGASTGGTEAITALLKQLPEDCPGIVIAQHMPAGFTRSFAARLQSLCSIQVLEAKHEEVIESGHAYIAPGNSHLVVEMRAGCYYTILSNEDPVNLHKPSIDVLFESVSANIKTFGIGVLLTGMGKDGAAGLLKMKQAGALTFAQDEKSCVVYGMPREAMKLGAAIKQLSIPDIADSIASLTASKPTS